MMNRLINRLMNFSGSIVAVCTTTYLYQTNKKYQLNKIDISEEHLLRGTIHLNPINKFASEKIISSTNNLLKNFYRSFEPIKEEYLKKYESQVDHRYVPIGQHIIIASHTSNNINNETRKVDNYHCASFKANELEIVDIIGVNYRPVFSALVKNIRYDNFLQGKEITVGDIISTGNDLGINYYTSLIAAYTHVDHDARSANVSLLPGGNVKSIEVTDREDIYPYKVEFSSWCVTLSKLYDSPHMSEKYYFVAGGSY